MLGSMSMCFLFQGHMSRFQISFPGCMYFINDPSNSFSKAFSFISVVYSSNFGGQNPYEPSPPRKPKQLIHNPHQMPWHANELEIFVFPKNRGTVPPKWTISNGKTLLKWDDLGGKPTNFWKHPYLFWQVQPSTKVNETGGTLRGFDQKPVTVTYCWCFRNPAITHLGCKKTGT